MVVEFWRARVNDVEAIVGLSGILFREDAGSRAPLVNLGWPEDEGWEYFAGPVAGGSSVCLVAESGRGVTGYLAGCVREGTSLRPVRTAELESMCVREEHRRRGVGERLVGEFLKWAGARGAECASVTVYVANEHAISFYEKSGFRPRSLSLVREIW